MGSVVLGVSGCSRQFLGLGPLRYRHHKAITPLQFPPPFRSVPLPVPPSRRSCFVAVGTRSIFSIFQFQGS